MNRRTVNHNYITVKVTTFFGLFKRHQAQAKIYIYIQRGAKVGIQL